MKNRFLAFLFFTACTILPTGSSGQIVDSLHHLFEAAETDSNRLTLLNELVRYTYLNDREASMEYARTYLQLANRSGTPRQKGKGLNFVGMIHSLNDQIDSAVTYYLSSLERFEEAKDTLYIGILYNNIAAAYQLREKQEETIEYFLQALHYVELAGDDDWVANIHFNLGRPYERLGQYDKSLEHIRMALSYFEKAGHTNNQCYAWHSIANLKQIQGKPLEAIQACRRALKFLDSSYDSSMELRIRGTMGRAYIELGRYPEALEQIQGGIAAAEGESFGDKVFIYDALREYYQTTGNYQQALIVYDSLLEFRDSLFNSEKDEQLTNALTRYQTERKQRQIDLLEADGRMQALQLAQSQRERRIFLTGMVLLAILLFAILYLFMQNRRARRTLELQNKQIEKALQEKDLLLREIHHRVKNNLQIISSLLSLQSRTIQDESAAEAIRESQNRVRSMAILHQNLYQQEHVAGMNVAEFIGKLTDHLKDSYYDRQSNISITPEVEELILDVELLVPLGLILNELLTNALKYAFPAGQAGQIRIQLQSIGEELQLTVSDDGKGLETDVDLESPDHFGFRMIRAFAAKLQGRVSVRSEKGTIVSLRIPNYKSHIA